MQGCESCCLKLNLSMAISQKKKKKQEEAKPCYLYNVNSKFQPLISNYILLGF